MASPCCGASRPVSSKRKKTRKQKTRRKSDTALKNMVRLSGGTFLMGTDSNEGFAEDGEGPVREVTVNPFYLEHLRRHQCRLCQIRPRNRVQNRSRTLWLVPLSSTSLYPPALQSTSRKPSSIPPGGLPLTAPAGTGPKDRAQRSTTAGTTPRIPHLVERRRRLLQLGGKTPAHRSRMGICRTGRPKKHALPLGRRSRTRWQTHVQHLAGHLPRTKQQSRWVHRHRTRHILPP